MTKDFSKYQHLIDQFRGKVSAGDFESKYAAATKQLPNSEKFILKMELKRLATPCTRLIDLRGHVDGECREFEHDGRRHFLDPVAIKVYQDNVKHYGSYTFGVYEAVTNTENNFRVIYQKEKAGALEANKGNKPKAVAQPDKTNYPATLVKFGQYHNRKEERMNFAIPLEFSINGGEMISAVSSDISVSGCKVRLKSPINIPTGTEIVVRFTGMEKEFEFGNEAAFGYIVRNINYLESDQYLGIERIGIAEPDSYMLFLKGYIQGNKRRYKINLENTFSAIVTRGYEQFALPKTSELPVFINTKETPLSPKYSLTSANNHDTFLYWQDERRQSVIANLLNPSRLKRLQSLEDNETLLVFCFKHKSKGKVFFYSADEKQLEADVDFYRQYLGFAANKDDFAVFKIKGFPIDSMQCYSPLTLADTLEKKDAYLDLPPSEEVLHILSPLKYLVTVVNVTDENAVEEYKLLSEESIDVKKLKQFGHKWQQTPEMVHEVKINYKNQRQEPRFIYKTRVEMESTSGRKLVGRSIDFSTLGIGVSLSEPCLLKRGDVVKLSFPELQKITTKFDLVDLPYEVMRLNDNNTVVNLRVVVRHHQHMGRAFFKLLIEKNQHKLEADEYALLVPGLAKALRNVYGNFNRAMDVYVQSSGSRYKFEKVGACGVHGRFMNLVGDYKEGDADFNLYPLLHNLKVYDKITSALKRMITTDKAEHFKIYLSYRENREEIEQVFIGKLGEELQQREHRHFFIKKALKQGEFFCLHISLSRAGTPDMEQLNPELSYVGAYAIHRAKSIEQELWSVVGIAQVIDVTKEELLRYEFLKD